MSLKPAIYESLSAPQRVIATIEALARGDREEEQRLTESCPFKTYRQRDAAFSDTMDSLIAMSIAVELDLTACALSFLALARHPEEQLEHLQKMANIQGGWLAVLDELGTRPDAMLGSGPPRHCIVTYLLTVIPECDPDPTKDFTETFRKYISP